MQKFDDAWEHRTLDGENGHMLRTDAQTTIFLVPAHDPETQIIKTVQIRLLDQNAGTTVTTSTFTPLPQHATNDEIIKTAAKHALREAARHFRDKAEEYKHVTRAYECKYLSATANY